MKSLFESIIDLSKIHIRKEEREGKMLLYNYTLKMVLSDYNPLSQKVYAIADLSEDISEVLPYLNTVLKGLQYNKEEKILIVKRGGRGTISLRMLPILRWRNLIKFILKV